MALRFNKVLYILIIAIYCIFSSPLISYADSWAQVEALIKAREAVLDADGYTTRLETVSVSLNNWRVNLYKKLKPTGTPPAVVYVYFTPETWDAAHGCYCFTRPYYAQMWTYYADGTSSYATVLYDVIGNPNCNCSGTYVPIWGAPAGGSYAPYTADPANAAYLAAHLVGNHYDAGFEPSVLKYYGVGYEEVFDSSYDFSVPTDYADCTDCNVQISYSSTPPTVTTVTVPCDCYEKCTGVPGWEVQSGPSSDPSSYECTYTLVYNPGAINLSSGFFIITTQGSCNNFGSDAGEPSCNTNAK